MKIILTTMVKNEARALPRLIRSAAKIVDAVALTDTGSTDDTVAVATAVCKELDLPLDVRVCPWQDFGTNRTLNLEHGKAVAAGLGDPKDSMLLLLDADMEVPANIDYRVEFPFTVGMLPQRDPRGMVWSNVRLFRADIDGRYIGRTHEYLSNSEKCVNCNWFTIEDHGDGGCKADKFERDERLLRMDLEENPHNPRSLFYLGQTLQNLGRKNEAISLYDRRAQLNDFPEEAWMAAYEASRCSDGPERDVRALAAYYRRPWRAEPLADVAVRAADQGRHHFALAMAAIGKQIPFPASETLYCSPDPYRWSFRYAEMVSAFYVGEKALGGEACDYLHFTPGSPHAVMALNNVVFYTEPLPGERRPFEVEPMEGFTPASPCFAPLGDGWLAMIRMVNYQITAEGYFVIPGDKVVTRNVVYRLNRKMQRLAPPVELISPVAPNQAAQITGFEDQRIVSIEGDILVTAGVRCDASPIGQPELWEATWNLMTGEYLKGRKLSKGENIEKNWLPFKGGYLYGHHPVTTFVDGDGNNPRFIPKHLTLGFFRGSAAPIPYKGGYLYVIHEVAAQGRRVYLHRFVHVRDDNWSKMRISRPFFLKGSPCMESCFSINEVDDGVMLSCAYEDKEVYTLTVQNEVVLQLLKEGTHE